MPRKGRGARAAWDAAAAIFTIVIVAAPAPALARSRASSSSCDDATSRSAQASTAQLEDSVTCLLNQERRKANLRRVSDSRKLESAALRHARDMRDRDYFSHTSLDGRSFSQRILEAGYMRGQEAGPWKVGETLAWATDGLSSPGQLVANLMNSPPHREVILDPEYREVGVGLVRGTPTTDPGGVTLVVDFGTLKPSPRSDPAPPPASSPPAGTPAPASPEDEDHPKGRDRGRDRDDAGKRGRGHGKHDDD